MIGLTWSLFDCMKELFQKEVKSLEDIERMKKVNKLKEKILTEIDKRLKLFIVEIDSSIPMEDYIFCVNESFSLHKLKLFVKSNIALLTKNGENILFQKKIWIFGYKMIMILY